MWPFALALSLWQRTTSPHAEPVESGQVPWLIRFCPPRFPYIKAATAMVGRGHLLAVAGRL